MSDFVVYHNPDRMGYPAARVDVLSIVTNKRVTGAEGGRVWLITGEGAPRRFFLRGVFEVETIRTSSHPKFRTQVAGRAGQLFDPMLPLDDELWFPDFKKSQGNFAFGFQAIKERRFIDGLLHVAGFP